MAAKNMLDSSYVVDDVPDEEDPTAPGDGPADDPESPVETKPDEPAAKVPLGRRARAKQAQEELLAEIRASREEGKKRDEQWAERVSRLERDNAELRGSFQGYMSRPQQAEPRQEAPNPEKLLEEANAALDAKDFAKYQKKYADYIEARVVPRFPAQQPAQQQPQVSPMLQVIAGQYADVMTDAAAFEIAQAHDRILARQGLPEGPDRWKRAFEEGRRFMGSKNPKPQTFSAKSKEVLAAPPTQRNAAPGNGGGGQQGVRLTELERQTAKKFKMSLDRYAAHLAAMHPERIEEE